MTLQEWIVNQLESCLDYDRVLIQDPLRLTSAAEARVDQTKAKGEAFELAQQSLYTADSMLVKGEKGEYGPLAKGERLNDTWMHGEIASAAFLQASAEQLEAELASQCQAQKFQLEQDLSTLEDYRLYLNSLLKGGSNP